MSPTIPIVTVLEVKRNGGAGPSLKWSPLLEPVRPWVDQWVWRLANSGQLSPDQFAYSQAGGCRLDKEARTVFFGEWHAVEAGVAPASATGARACAWGLAGFDKEPLDTLTKTQNSPPRAFKQVDNRFTVYD